MQKTIFWDFDGTLALRPRMFSAGLRMVLDEFEHGHKMTEDSFAPWLRTGFPWHEPDREYLHLLDPDAWWANMHPVFERAYAMNGIAPEKASRYAKEARRVLACPDHFSLFDDTLETLIHLKQNGYRHLIVSNHIPELPAIAEKLGLLQLVDACISSANVGYEKPNPRIFYLALERAGIRANPETVWMVGDNLNADVRGAEAVGINAVLVRRSPIEPVKHFSPDLRGVIRLVS